MKISLCNSSLPRLNKVQVVFVVVVAIASFTISNAILNSSKIRFFLCYDIIV